MTTIGKAAQASLNFLKSVNPDVQDILVEEVEQKEDTIFSSIWFITLSYTPVTNNPQNALAAIAGNRRRYKVFEVEVFNERDVATVKSMKIREFSTAA